MKKVSRQQRRKLLRDYKNNEWYVRDWQRMQFLRTENDTTGTGTVDIYVNEIYTCIKRVDRVITWLSIKKKRHCPYTQLATLTANKK